VYVVSVTVVVKPEYLQAFVASTFDNAKNTRKEPGNLRFDFLQAEDDSAKFLLYEAYRTKEDFAAHQKTAHYLRWKDRVAPWMAQPRQGVKHRSLFFGDRES
jgi:autoinducer 2-degrading protein